jgi:hypothetical protein
MLQVLHARQECGDLREASRRTPYKVPLFRCQESLFFLLSSSNIQDPAHLTVQAETAQSILDAVSTMSKTILILGASWSGLTVTHKYARIPFLAGKLLNLHVADCLLSRLLKQTLNTLKDYHIILVSPTTHLYCNLAAVRGKVELVLMLDHAK